MTFDFTYGTDHNRFVEQHWGPGYPDCQEDEWVSVVAANGVSFGRLHRDIAELVVRLVDECTIRGYEPKKGQCWGSVCRCSHRSDGTCAEDSDGNPVPSNHSYGIAIDFNSLDNPYGGTSYKMPAWVPTLFRDYGFRWLGPPIRDWQHFDFAGTPADAARMLAKARNNRLGEDPDEMAYADFKDGIQARLDGRAFNEDWPNDKKFGWRLQERLVQAATTPEPGAPQPHSHPHTHTIARARTGGDEAVV